MLVFTGIKDSLDVQQNYELDQEPASHYLSFDEKTTCTKPMEWVC
jgi:hypothetical protein